MPEEPSRRWMTYAEIADALNLPTAKAGEAKARRAGWERQIGNDGFARVAVPLSVLEEPHPLRRAYAKAQRRPYEEPAESAFLAELKATHEREAGELRRRAEQAERERDAARALAEQQAGELADTRQQLGQAQGEGAALRDALAHERAQATAERAGRERAEAARDGALADRDAARAELAHWTAGGPFARALRGFLTRRGRP